MLYPKINGVFKRNDKGKFITDEYARPEFKELENVQWLPTEKVDGTNIRVYVDEDEIITIRGKTNKATLLPSLVEHLHAFNYADATGLTLYGEGFGGKIQRGAGYLPTESFILFDALTPTNRWLSYDELAILAQQLNMPLVIPYKENTLQWWINYFKTGGKPQSYLRDGYAEGIVLTPVQGYRNRYGERIITKLKVHDFE